MKWFKHLTSSHIDEKLAAYLSENGLEGYGFWWMLMEVVAAQCVDDKCSATYSLPHWSRHLYCHHHKVSKYMGKLGVTGIVRVEYLEGNIRVTIPNLLKYRDEYSQKSRQKKDNIRPKKEKEKEKEKESQKKATTIDPNPNPDKKESKPKATVVSLPDWVPKESWANYLKTREKMKKPLLPESFKYAFTKLEKLKTAGHHPQDVLDQSSFYCWQGLFEIKEEFKKTRPERFPTKGESITQANKESSERVRRLLNDQDNSREEYPAGSSLQTGGSPGGDDGGCSSVIVLRGPG